MHPLGKDMPVERIGKYRIQQLIARGGMGALYLAHDPDLDREVAIKVMSESIMRDEQARERFYREARAAARLQHRNIVTVFDFAHDGETPYFVMELLRGQNLSQRLQHGPPLTMRMKLDLAMQLCEGLHFAHGEGVIHRDVKPANIWLLDDGGVKLLDFGIAKSSAGTLTLGGSVVGSAGYMSPEHIEGQPVDHRSDVFSVGAVLFELIAGRPPFDGDSVTAVMMKIVQDEPAPDIRILAPDTPVALGLVISRALEKDPDRRYADAAHMAADLRAVKQEITEHEEQAESAAGGDEHAPVCAAAAPELRNDQERQHAYVKARAFEIVHPAEVAVADAEQVLVEEARKFDEDRRVVVERENLTHSIRESRLRAGDARTVEQPVNVRKQDGRGEHESRQALWKNRSKPVLRGACRPIRRDRCGKKRVKDENPDRVDEYSGIGRKGDAHRDKPPFLVNPAAREGPENDRIGHELD